MWSTTSDAIGECWEASYDKKRTAEAQTTRTCEAATATPHWRQRAFSILMTLAHLFTVGNVKDTA